MRDARAAEGGADVVAGGVAGVVDGDGGGLAGEGDGGDVEVVGGCLGGAGGAGLLLLGLGVLVGVALRAWVCGARGWAGLGWEGVWV